MKAVVFNDINDLVFKEIENPKLENDNDIILKVTLTTICSSDIHIKKGFVPRAKKELCLGMNLLELLKKREKM